MLYMSTEDFFVHYCESLHDRLRVMLESRLCTLQTSLAVSWQAGPLQIRRAPPFVAIEELGSFQTSFLRAGYLFVVVQPTVPTSAIGEILKTSRMALASRSRAFLSSLKIGSSTFVFLNIASNNAERWL